MDFITIILIGAGLSIDSLVVSITAGMSFQKIKIRNSIKIALFMAVFQGLFPFIGWLAGIKTKEYIQMFDHWVAFSLLAFIGGKMVYDGIKYKRLNRKTGKKITNLMLIGMAIATSIDALIVGIGFGLLNIAILLPVILITTITFIFSYSGVFIGWKIGDKYNKGLEITGGLVLVFLGAKILIQHLYF